MNGWRQAFKNDDPERAADKNRDRRFLRFLCGIKVWQLLIILLIFVMLAAIFLRLNNIGMIERRDELIAADETGDVAEVQAAAVKLQNYMANHMNTAAGRIALQTLYDDAVQKALDAARPAEIDASAYARAQEECRPARTSGGARAWARCVSDAIGVTETEAKQVEAISPDAFYVYFAPTRWSPDAAGITILICCLLILAILVRVILAIILRVILKIKYRAA